MYEAHHLPTVDTSAASVEEIATVVIQTLAQVRRRKNQPAPGTRRGRDLLA
jgi:regulator of PEP synthase PpsR (kinase-PPPase family)